MSLFLSLMATAAGALQWTLTPREMSVTFSEAVERRRVERIAHREKCLAVWIPEVQDSLKKFANETPERTTVRSYSIGWLACMLDQPHLSIEMGDLEALAAWITANAPGFSASVRPSVHKGTTSWNGVVGLPDDTAVCIQWRDDK